MDLEAGGSNDDNLKTLLRALIDSGAGATIGWLKYFEAVVLINPRILVQILPVLEVNTHPSPCME